MQPFYNFAIKNSLSLSLSLPVIPAYRPFPAFSVIPPSQFRSMGGNRDSEIGFGAWETDHVWTAENGTPKGGIHDFRMALWAAHLGG